MIVKDEHTRDIQYFCVNNLYMYTFPVIDAFSRNNKFVLCTSPWWKEQTHENEMTETWVFLAYVRCLVL